MALFSELCMNCMSPLPEGHREEEPCPCCGDVASRPNPAEYLQIGASLCERYAVGRLQRAGGDAAVYAGYDKVLKSPILLREFFPDALCTRGEDDQLIPIAGGEKTFEEYLNKFLVHARKVARMRDLPASIPTYDIFQENGTAYTVSERCEGQTLAAYLETCGGRLSWEEARPLFMPLMTSLISLHKAEVYHLGLSPDTLVMGDDGKLHLDGFAIPEARQAAGELTPQLASGYAAPEQYDESVPCGAATDVYGLAAVIFRTLVGEAPPDGETRPRANSDLIVPAEAADALPSHVAAALFGALQPSLDKRIPSLSELQDRLAAAPAVAELLSEEEDTPGGAVPINEEDEEEYEEEEERSHRGLWIALTVIAFLLLIGFGAWLLLDKLFPNRLNPGRTDPTPTTTLTTGTITISETTAQAQPDMLASVPNVVGRSYSELRGHFVDNRAILLEGMKYSDTVPAGVILSQRPDSREEVDITQPVYVIVSAGSEYVTLPDLTGWRQDQAERYLKDMGFTIAVDVVPVSAQEAGYVDSTSPARGNAVLRGSEVRLRISAREPTTTTTTTTQAPTTTTTVPAPTYVSVPDVSGWKQEHAEMLLKLLGFEVTVERLPDSALEAGLVEDTVPPRDSRLLKGSQIQLRVSARTSPQPSDNGSTTPTEEPVSGTVSGDAPTQAQP